MIPFVQFYIPKRKNEMPFDSIVSTAMDISAGMGKKNKVGVPTIVREEKLVIVLYIFFFPRLHPHRLEKLHTLEKTIRWVHM